MREKFWELAGSKMGDLLKIQKEVKEEESSDYSRKDNQFAHQFAKQSGGAVSDFARFKSMQEQREFLPVFAVKEELMTIIRDN